MQANARQAVGDAGLPALGFDPANHWGVRRLINAHHDPARPAL